MVPTGGGKVSLETFAEIPVARLKIQTHEMALAACTKQGVAFPPVAETTLAVALGLGRIVALHYPSSDLHHTR